LNSTSKTEIVSNPWIKRISDRLINPALNAVRVLRSVTNECLQSYLLSIKTLSVINRTNRSLMLSDILCSCLTIADTLTRSTINPPINTITKIIRVNSEIVLTLITIINKNLKGTIVNLAHSDED